MDISFAIEIKIMVITFIFREILKYKMYNPFILNLTKFVQSISTKIVMGNWLSNKKTCLIMRFTSLSQIGSVASTVFFSKMHNKNPGIINVTLNIYKIHFCITIPNDLSFLQYSFQCKSLFLFICSFLWLLKKIKMKKNSIQWH